MWGTDTCFSAKFCIFEVPVYFEFSYLGGGRFAFGFVFVFVFGKSVSASLTCFHAVLLLFVVQAEVFFREHYPVYSCEFVVSMKGEKFRMSVSWYLEPDSQNHLDYLCFAGCF